MENFGIILSVPGAFIASILFSTIMGKVADKWPNLTHPLTAASTAVLLAAIVEAIANAAIGPVKLQEMTGNAFYPFHVVTFLLTLPALSCEMKLQEKFKSLTKWYVLGFICAVVGLLIVLQQYAISEAIFSSSTNR